MIKNIDQFISELLTDFNPNQVKVLSGRFGLKNGEELTLQSIGDEIGITRERVRQIEEYSIKKLTPKIKEKAGEFLKFSNKHLLDLGGVRRDDNFINDIKYLLKLNENAVKNADQKIRFLYFIAETPNYQTEDDDMHGFWYSDDKAKNKFLDLVKNLTTFLRKSDKKAILEDKAHLKYSKDFVSGHLISIPKHFGSNIFGDFGLREWPEIEPRGIRDKIYLVLRKYGKPLHFEEIAKQIKNFAFDNKPVHAQTAHNELISDDRFVLVGRGIYGLKELGYEPGTVKDVIVRLLKKNGPLTAKEVVNSVAKDRFFKENTVLLNLQNRQYFKKLPDGRYAVIK